MAKTTGPLLSLGASGQIAKTLVAMTWKGLNTMRQYVKPANPNTAAQQTQRGFMTDVVAAYRNYFTNTVGRSAWNRLAGASGEVMSGFNMFTRCDLAMAIKAPFWGMALTAVAFTGNTAKFEMLDGLTGGVSAESGNFEVWVGDKANSLLLLETKTISTGFITTSDLGDMGDVKYVKIRKDDVDRSGIFQLTLIA